MKELRRPDQSPDNSWSMALVTLWTTLASSLAALVCGLVLAELNSTGTYRAPSWGARGTATFHATLLVWLLGYTGLAIYLLYRRKYASFAGILLGGLLAVSTYHYLIIELIWGS